MNIPENLKYTREHEWIKIDGNKAVVGITDYAQEELGEIVFVEIETVGDTILAEDVFGTVEAVKTVSDVFMPVSGKIMRKNESLDGHPEFVNSDPYGEGWLIELEFDNKEGLDNLLDAKAYAELIR